MNANIKRKPVHSLPVELTLLIQKIPELFTGKYKSVLYVGANHLQQHFLEEFVISYEKVAVLELFGDNAKFLKEIYSNPNTGIVHGDVRNAASLLGQRFDVCFFWHGPDHLHKEDMPEVIMMLEKITNNLVILGMPYGDYVLGSEFGIKHETHLWDIYHEDMQRMEYGIRIVGDKDGTRCLMMAWKYM